MKLCSDLKSPRPQNWENIYQPSTYLPTHLFIVIINIITIILPVLM